MTDLKQLAKDVEQVAKTNKIVEQFFGGSPEFESEQQFIAMQTRILAFVRDLTDQSPATPEDCHSYGIDAYRGLGGDTVAQFGDNEHHQYRVTVRTRGQLLALAIGLELRGSEK